MMISSAACAPLPDLIMSYHLRPRRSASISGFPANRSGKIAHVVRVIGDHEEIERAR
jgi:hypothetical protein